MVYVSGVAAPQPMSPPASLIACMPSLRRGRAAGDVDLAEHADDERGQADHDPAVRVGLLGCRMSRTAMTAEQYRHEQVEAAEGAGHQHLDEIADGAAQIGPGARGDDQREAEQQQRDAVLAVRRVEALGALPYAAEHGADGVREPEPQGAYEPVTPPVGSGRRLRGAGFFAAAFLAGAFFAAAFFAAAFFAGAFVGAAAFFAGGFLAADGREAMCVRLPVETTADTCAYCFTRSCRPSR